MICRDDSMPSLTLKDFFEKFYQPSQLLGCSPRSAEDYPSLFRSLAEFSGRDWLLRDLTDDNVSAYLGWLIAVRGRAPATANKHRACLVALCRYACRRRIVDKIGSANVPPYVLEVDKLPVPKRMPESWTLDELTRLLAATADETGTIGTAPASLWWQAFISFLFATGYRIEQVLRLPPSAFEANSKTLIVPAELTKDRADDARRLAPAICQLLEQIVDRQADRLFAWPYDSQRQGSDDRLRARATSKTIRLHFRRIMERAGLTTRRWLFHKMRASHATELQNAGGDATASLGHSSPTLTVNSYLDPRNLRRQSPAELLPAIPLPSRQIKLFG